MVAKSDVKPQALSVHSSLVPAVCGPALCAGLQNHDGLGHTALVAAVCAVQVCYHLSKEHTQPELQNTSCSNGFR